MNKSSFSPLLHQANEDLLRSLGIENLADAEKEKVLPALVERLSNVAMETAVEIMSEEQRTSFLGALKDPETAEEKIAEISASIPGLKERIDSAVEEEILTLRAAQEILKAGR